MELPETAPGWFARPSDWSVLRIGGADAQPFLQGFVTCDVLRLAEGEASEGFFPDAKAHIVAYGVVARTADGFAVLLTSPRASELAAHLDRYVIRERVTLAPSTPGAASGERPLVTDEAAGVSAEGLQRFPLEALGGGAAAWWGDGERIGRLAAELDAGGARELSAEEFALARIAAGMPLDRVDIDQRNLPQEVDRTAEAISFRKGCYLGQEPIARIDALGRVNWLLRRLRLGAPAPVGAELTAEGRVVGRVTSCAACDAGAVALGYVRREHAAPGDKIACGAITATVL